MKRARSAIQKDRMEITAYLRRKRDQLVKNENARIAVARQLYKLERELEKLYLRSKDMIKHIEDVQDGKASFPGKYRHSHAAIRKLLAAGMSVEAVSKRHRFGLHVIERIKKEMTNA